MEEDCEICCETRTNLHACERCVHRWCEACHARLRVCPFCRIGLSQVGTDAYEVQLELEFETDEWIGWF